MTKLDMGQAFPLPQKKPATKAVRTYDVRITLNNSGHRMQVVRVGFINKAAKTFGIKPFIEASSIEYTKDRIYFRSHDEKGHANIHVLSSNGKAHTDSCYFTMTPSDKAEKMYRMNWIGKSFPLFYDSENELYYIDSREEN